MKCKKLVSLFLSLLLAVMMVMGLVPAMGSAPMGISRQPVAKIS